MKRLYLLTAAALLSSTVIAQKNFQPGFVITANGDTIKGEINNLLWQEAPKYVTFSGPKGQVQYEPEDLRGFSAGEHTVYKSFKVKIDTTGGTGGDRSETPTPTFFEDQVFLKVILEGHYSLLKVRQGFRTHFFIQEKGQVPEELISHSSQRMIASTLLVQPGNQFIIQLKEKMSDCPKVEINNNMKYLESSLMDVFTKYNECKSSKILIPGDESKHIYTGLVGGLNYDKFTYKATGGVGYTAGVFFEMTFPRNVYRSSWYTELLYYRYGNQQSGPLTNGFTGVPEIYRYEYGTLKVNTMAKYQFIYSKTRPYLLAGVGKVLATSNINFYVNDKKTRATMQGSWDVLLGFGVYPAKRLSAEIRVYRTLLTTLEKAGPYNSQGGPTCNSVGLFLAYHIPLKE